MADIDLHDDLETGYLNQFTNALANNRDSHILTTTLGFKF
jgi:hypothetical protein